MAKQIVVLVGSARQESDTRLLVSKVFPEPEIILLDLLDFTIAPYNYAGVYPETDNFLALIQKILEHEIIVFATPVYWYAMSAIMKNFFDRLTDLSTIHKTRGRELAGKLTSLLAIGSDPELPSGFEVPFQLTSTYFAMDFRGSLYYSIKNPEAADAFQDQVKKFKNKLSY